MLKLPPAPLAAIDAAIGAIGRLAPSLGAEAAAVQGRAIRLSCELWTTTFEDARQGPPHLMARPVGWKHLLDWRSHAIVVHRHEGPVPYVFAALEKGPQVAATDMTFDRLASAASLRDQDYEAVLLAIPSVYVTAIWLRTAGAVADRFWVLDPAHHLVPAERLLSEPEFSAAFAAAVQDMVAKRVIR